MHVVSKSDDGKAYICNPENGSRSVCVYPSDIKQVLAGDLEVGRRIEVVCYKETSSVNVIRVCCLASVLPNEIAPTVKMEPPSIDIGEVCSCIKGVFGLRIVWLPEVCPDQCPDREMLWSFVLSSGGPDEVKKELGALLSSSILHVTRDLCGVKME